MNRREIFKSLTAGAAVSTVPAGAADPDPDQNHFDCFVVRDGARISGYGGRVFENHATTAAIEFLEIQHGTLRDGDAIEAVDPRSKRSEWFDISIEGGIVEMAARR